MPAPSPESFPLPVFARVDGEAVLRPALGLTAYLDNPAWWAVEGAQKAVELFLSVVPEDRLEVYTTSSMQVWQPIDKGDLQRVRQALSSWLFVSNTPRHHLQVRLADVPNLPEIGFSYTEVDPARARRAAVLELTLPPSAPPEHLFQLAQGLARLGHLSSLVGGYVARWNPLHRRLAFDSFFLWSQRYLGLDIQDAEAAAYGALTGVPGVNWLVLLGTSVLRAREFDAEALLRRRWEHDVSVTREPAGVLLRAGARPSLGDLNVLEVPAAYHEVAAAVAPCLDTTSPPFPGVWAREDLTQRWRLRFQEAGVWPLE